MKWIFFLLFIMTFQLSGQNTISLIKSTPRKETLNRTNTEALIVIPMEIARGMIFVEGVMNGRKGDFILDTGAPMMVVNKTPDELESQDVRSFSGSFAAQEIQIEEFELAGTKWKNTTALALDISHLERASNRKILGMIGYNTLREFEILVDYHQNQLVLLPPHKKNLIHRAASPLFSIPFEIQDHLPVIEVRFGDQLLKMGLDTGAGANLIDDDFLASLSDDEHSLELTAEEIQGIDGKIERVQARQAPSQLELNEKPLDPMKYLFPDLSHLSATTGLHIDGLLGSPFFQSLKFSINYKTQKIHIWAVY